MEDYPEEIRLSPKPVVALLGLEKLPDVAAAFDKLLAEDTSPIKPLRLPITHKFPPKKGL